MTQNDPAGCLELLSIAQNQSYVSIRNLKARALVRLDRVDDALPILRSVLEQDVAYGTRRTQPSFFSDVVNRNLWKIPSISANILIVESIKFSFADWLIEALLKSGRLIDWLHNFSWNPFVFLPEIFR